MKEHGRSFRRLGPVLIVASLGALAAWGAEPEFRRPTAEEALKFLQSMPRVNRNHPPNFVPRFKGERYFVQLFKDCSIHDIADLRHIGYGNFKDVHHDYLRIQSPRGTRFYECKPI